MNSSNSDRLSIRFGVLQGSILGLLLCNAFLADLFFIINEIDIASYTNDSTPYVIDNDKYEVIESIEEVSSMLFKWPVDNLMKSNANKYHLLVSAKAIAAIKIGNFDISNTRCEKLGVTFDQRLTFDYHIRSMQKKTSCKIHALARITL